MNIKLVVRKGISTAIVASLVAGALLPGFASAATLQENLQLIQTLTNQIKELQARILSLQTEQKQLQATTSQTVLEIMQGLKEGSEGDQVAALQTLLAADSALYPEGKVTGFFGPATRRAIARFQARNGLEQVGSVGPKTRALLNAWIKEQFKSIDNLDDIDDDVADDIEDAIASITLPPLPSDPCGIPGLPFSGNIKIKDGKTKLTQTGNVFIYKDGKHKIIITPNTYHMKDGKKNLLITPGMRIEKDGKSKVIIPCNGNGNGTTTPPTQDTTAPTLSSINTTVTHQGAVVTWITNEAANSKVYYGTTTPLNTGTAQVVSSSVFQTGHTINVSGLTAATQYYYVIESKDVKGNTATSSQRTFTTNATPDTTAPTITAISATNVGTSTVTINWTTNESANSKVYYSTATPLITGTASTKTDATMVTSHSVGLTGLTPNTTYYFKVESVDASTNTTLSSETSFVTNALPPSDTTAPVISALTTTPASTTASVAWTTNEVATSKVYYGTVTPLVLASASTVVDNTLVTNRTLNLTGLTASTTYYMVAESKDAANNTATSSETSFLTTN